MKPESVQLPDELRTVPRPVLEEYVSARIKQFCGTFAYQLCPTAEPQAIDTAWSASLSLLGASSTGSNLDNCSLRFRHKCRFLGCTDKQCILCKNNPNKRCREDEVVDECYADGQVLRTKCEADMYVELSNSLTGLAQNVPGLEVQVCVIDGDSWNDGTPANHSKARKLLKSDQGECLISSAAAGIRPDAEGYLYLRLQDGHTRLPDVTVTDKNDTFTCMGESYSTFRLMASAVKRDLFGRAVLVEGIPPTVTARFIVKTQRALNDYRKSEYPHYKDELTKLKFIGSITAQRLREIQNHLGMDVPFTSIETVEQLKHLMLYADQNRQVENKLLELLNMKGKHKAKWDYLKEILNEKIVYDDVQNRAWFVDDSLSQGLLFPCKQGQVNLEKPLGLFRRGPPGILHVLPGPDPSTAETLRAWKQAAEHAWVSPNHGRWSIAQERLEMLTPGSAALLMNSPSSNTAGGQQVGPGGHSLSPTMSTQEPGAGEDQQMMYVRRSTVSSPLSRSNTPPDSHRHSFSQAPQLPLDLQATTSMPMPFIFSSTSPAGTSQGLTRMADSMPEVFNAHRNNQGVFHFMPGQHVVNPGSTTGTSEPDVYQHNRQPMELPASRSSRYRRLSADTPNTLHHHQLSGNAVPLNQMGSAPEQFSQFPPMDVGLHKRPRSSAPSGLYTSEEAAAAGFLTQGQLEAAAAERARLTLYHLESRGRHLPRGRKSQENRSPSATPSMSGNFDHNDLELDALLQNIHNDQPEAHHPHALQHDGVIKQEPGIGSENLLGTSTSMPARLGSAHDPGQGLLLLGQPLSERIAMQTQPSGGMQMQQMGGGSDLGPILNLASWQQNDLSMSIQHALNLGEDAGNMPAAHWGHQQFVQQAQLHRQQHVPVTQVQSQMQLHPQAPGQQQQQQQQQVGSQQQLTPLADDSMQRVPMLMVPDSDSFKSLSRLLRHSDSDSFKHLLSPLAQYQQGDFDPMLAEMLQQQQQAQSQGQGH